jgi:hypothetical protein
MGGSEGFLLQSAQRVQKLLTFREFIQRPFRLLLPSQIHVKKEGKFRSLRENFWRARQDSNLRLSDS